MNRQLASSVVDFLARPGADRAGPLRRFRSRQWRSSMHWLVTSGLALYLLDGLKRVSRLDVLPRATRAALEEMWSASEARVHALETSLLDLNQCFAGAGLRFANWKGFATVPDFCPDVRLRVFSDFDFFVDAKELPEFDLILGQCGYSCTAQSEEEVTYENLPGSLTRFKKSYHDRPSRRVELHTRLNGTIGKQRFPAYTGLLDRRLIQRRRGVDFPVPALADAFVLHALHCTRHFLDGWARPAWLLEIRDFIRMHSSDRELWAQAADRAQHMPGCDVLVGIAVWLSSCLFESHPDNCLGWALQPMPSRVIEWLQRFGRAAALAEFPGTKLPLMLVCELVDAASWTEFEDRRLVPIKKPPRVARPQDSSLRHRAIAAAWQMKFVWMRLRFHAWEGARYAIEKRRWNRVLTASAAQQTSLIS